MNNLQKVKVVVWTDYGTQYTTEGMMTGDEEYIHLTKKERIVVKPMLLRNEKGETIAYAPEKTHGNLDKKFLIDLAKAQKYTLKLFHKKDDGKVLECITECTGFIDPHLYENTISPSFGTDASTVLRSKILNILQEMGSGQAITLFIMGLLAGIPTGAILMIIGGSVFGG